jgi:hypothetical protein
MRARSESLARIDDHRHESFVRRLPRRPDPQRPDRHGPVERAPSVGPVRLDVAGDDVREDGAQRFLERRLDVRDERELLAQVDLLEAFGDELEQLRALCFDSAGVDSHRDAPEAASAQRKTARSRSKNPSSRS